MRESTIHALVVARTLLEQADSLCSSDDRYLASSGLVILQDALEIILFALLLERGVDDEKSLERKGFDELIGELKGAGISVPRSGTLKALNKQRILVKHYAQLAEPALVRSYFSTAQASIALMTQAVLGQSLHDLFIADLLSDGESKAFLKAAEVAIQERRYFDALVEIRKAIFVEFEVDYSIYGWRNYDGTEQIGLFGWASFGGWRAPGYTQKKAWIDANVIVPTDYVQIDQQDWRLQAMELGIHTVELQNLQRLTPAVFRADPEAGWSVTYDATFVTNNATESNARYCLDRAVSIILKKQQHAKVRRDASREVAFDPPPIYTGHTLHERPSTDSPSVHTVQEGYTYSISRIVSGFNPEEVFYEVLAMSDERTGTPPLELPVDYARGYLLRREE